MQVSPINDLGQPAEHSSISLNIPERFGQRVSYGFEGTPNLGPRTGEQQANATTLKIDLAAMKPVERLRLGFPTWNSRARIIGLRFDDSQLNWPWDHKARLIIADSTCEVGTMVFSFDPAKILPKTLQHRSVRVVNDCGSSVLLEIIPSDRGGSLQ